MITSHKDLEEATAFERDALLIAGPLVTRGMDTLDLRGSKVAQQTRSTSVGWATDDRCEELLQRLRPLFFGAAWKAIDLLLEFAFHQEGLHPKQPGKWTFKEKSILAMVGHGRCPPLSDDKGFWIRLCKLYGELLDVRHSIVHKRFVLSGSGDITAIRAENGTARPNLTAEEQEAFCRTAQRALDACLTSRFATRERADMAWWLDKLAAHHGMAALGGLALRPIEKLQVDAALTPSGGWTVDLAYAASAAASRLPGRSYFDVEIHFPGAGLRPVTGRLEEAPKQDAVPIDPTSPPPWVIDQ